MTGVLRALGRRLYWLVDSILCVAVGLAIGYTLLVVGAQVMEAFGD